MFAAPAFVLGAILGWVRATRGGGNIFDKLQYATVFGLILFLLALGLTILADWQGWI